jgi:hypothetical protein
MLIFTPYRRDKSIFDKEEFRFGTDFVLDRSYSAAIREALCCISTECLIFCILLPLHQEVNYGTVCVEGVGLKYVWVIT